MTDSVKTIRKALRAAIAADRSVGWIGPCLRALEAVKVIEEERQRLRAALGIIARECVLTVPLEVDPVYHRCYLALVGDLTLPANQQAEIMRAAIDAAIGEPPKDHIVDPNEKVEGRVSVSMSEGEGPDHIHNAVKMIEEPIPHLMPEQYEQILADIDELACNPGQGEDLQLALSRIIQLARKEELPG